MAWVTSIMMWCMVTMIVWVPGRGEMVRRVGSVGGLGEEDMQFQQGFVTLEGADLSASRHHNPG